jgi:NAD(P)-dependent dehydrogenase (short-subunit alcohol dehydrogenase family)
MVFKDKVVIVSGIGPGLGVDLARVAAKEGAKVAIGARTVSYLEEIAKEIGAAGGEVMWVRTDICKPEDCKAMAKAVIDKWGRIDALINNGYKYLPFSEFETANLDEWRAMHDVNLWGTLQMGQACVPQMKKQGRGYIVNVSTMAHKKPLPTMGGYASSKAGLEGATRHMALELAKYGIRCNCARMGWIGGPPNIAYFSQLAKDSGVDLETAQAPVVKNIPLGFFPPGEDCARAVLFLATPWADAVVGAVLDVNGGEFMT